MESGGFWGLGRVFGLVGDFDIGLKVVACFFSISMTMASLLFCSGLLNAHT
jgi:hypothetical protein